MKQRNLLLLAVCCAVVATVASTATRLRVVDGYLVAPDGQEAWVGNTTSQLINEVLPFFTPPANVSTLGGLVNASVLRYLQLEGAYIADVPFVLPSLMVLDMRHPSAVMTAAEVYPGPARVGASGERV